MLLRSLVDQTLPVDKERGEQSLSPSARKLVFNGPYYFSSGIDSVGYKPAYHADRFLIHGDDRRITFGELITKPLFTYVVRKNDDPKARKPLVVGGGLPWPREEAVGLAAVNELSNESALRRASRVEDVARRLKRGLIFAGIVATSIGLLATEASAIPAHQTTETPPAYAPPQLDVIT